MSSPDQTQETNEKPTGLATFEEFSLYPEVTAAIGKLGFEKPTPVQARTYAEVMSGEDVIVMAQTGTGKTAAFGIPFAQKLDPAQKAVQALVLTPTRELALQVGRELDAIGKGRGLTCTAVYGGASFTKQMEEVKAGAQIVAGTPGRVLDHMRRRTIKFDALRIVVLDEADEMLSMGFEKEISAIMEGLPAKRQSMLFSATIPDDIQRLAGRYMGDATIISVSGDAVAAAEIAHYVYLVSGLERPRDLVKVLETERPSSAIVFCNTRDETQLVARYLKDAGFNAAWINSDLSQADREKVMNATRAGKIQFMVATDVAARGIDISHLSHVINYSFPESLEVYVHRTGRTGRQGRHGAAVSLITPQDIGNLYFLRLTYKIFPVEKVLPSSKQAARIKELERLERLRRTVIGRTNGEFVGLARRVMQDVQREQLIAGLIESYFADAPAPVAPPAKEEPPAVIAPEVEASPEPLPEPQPEPEPEPSASAPADAGATGGSSITKEKELEAAFDEAIEEDASAFAPADAGAPGGSSTSEVDDHAEAPSAKADAPAKAKATGGSSKTKEAKKPASAPAKPGATARSSKSRATKAKGRGEEERAQEIYVDAGRKDGLRISNLMKEIVEHTGLARSAVGRVRMLTRSTFIAVPEENFKKVLAALRKIKVDGRKLKAEPAEE